MMQYVQTCTETGVKRIPCRNVQYKMENGSLDHFQGTHVEFVIVETLDGARC